MNYENTGFSNKQDAAVLIQMGLTQSARNRVDEMLTNLEDAVATLRGKLDVALAKEDCIEKTQGKLTGATLHELHGWTVTAGDRVESITNNVRDLIARLDL